MSNLIGPDWRTKFSILTFFYSAFFAVILILVAVVVYVLTERSLTASLEEQGRQALHDLREGNIDQGLSRLPGDAYYEIVLYLLNVPETSVELIEGLRYSEFQNVSRNLREIPGTFSMTFWNISGGFPGNPSGIPPTFSGNFREIP